MLMLRLTCMPVLTLTLTLTLILMLRRPLERSESTKSKSVAISGTFLAKKCERKPNLTKLRTEMLVLYWSD